MTDDAAETLSLGTGSLLPVNAAAEQGKEEEKKKNLPLFQLLFEKQR